MKTLEDRIRAARPQAPPLPQEFTGRVMDEVVRLGLRPGREKAPAAVWLRLALGAVFLALGVAAVDGLTFEVRENGSLELLFFGTRFWGDFLLRLPYDLLLGAVAAAGGGAWLLRASPRPRVAAAWVVLFTYGVTGVGGLALAETGLNERVQALAQATPGNWPLVGGFFSHRARFRLNHPNLRVGKVLRVDGRQVRIQTPAGEEFAATLPPGMHPAVGDHLRLMGAQAGEAFAAGRGQFCDPSRTGRYFRHMGHGAGPGGMMPGMMMRPGAGGGEMMHRGGGRGGMMPGGKGQPMGAGMHRGAPPAQR